VKGVGMEVKDKIAILGNMNAKQFEGEAKIASDAALASDGKVNDWKQILANDKMEQERLRVQIITSLESTATNAEGRKLEVENAIASSEQWAAHLGKMAETEGEIAGHEAAGRWHSRDFQRAMYALKARTAMITFLGAGEVLEA